MKLGRLGPAAAYRMHTPKWASQPTSGAGASLHGGRANRPGTPALYLALDSETAVLEYQQTSTLLPPGTLVSYQVDVGPIVDFSVGFDARRWTPIWEDFACDWRALWFGDAVEPPSWVAADDAIDVGAKGIIFPSAVSKGGPNVVLYTELLKPVDTLEAHDPGGLLPRDQSSWT